MRFLADGSIVTTTQRSVELCGSWICKLNYDTLISSFVSILLTVAIAAFVARRLETRRPGKLQMLFEFLFSYIKDLVRDNVGAEAADALIPVALPIAFTITLYILVANWLGAFPLMLPLRPANADWNQTLALAIVVFLVVQWYGFKTVGFKGFFYKFTKPFEMPLLVRILFIPLNIIEEFIKPVTLSLRLFGNIFAGLVMVELLGKAFYLGGSGPFLGVTGAIFSGVMALWKGFDSLFIGAIQAFIFMLLTIIYFGMAREGLEEEGHAAHAAPAA